VHRLVALVALGFLFALAPAAPAGNPRGETLRPNAADQAAARAVTVKQVDLRPATGWTGGAVQPVLSPLTCADYHPNLSSFVSTGGAATDWYQGTDEVSTQSDVLQTAQMLAREWQLQISDPAFWTCVHHAAVKALSAQGAVVTSFARIPFPHIATYTAAYRLTLKVASLRLTIEVLDVGRGRTEIELEVSAVSKSKADAETRRLGRIVAARIRA
jgi:hypothetical protein